MQTPQRRSHMPSNAYCCAGEQPPLWWGWCKLLLWSCQSLSKCDSAGEMAENVSGLWTPPGALSNLFWWSGAVMAICRSPPSCTQPAARQAVVTTSLQCCFQQSAQTKKGLAVFTYRVWWGGLWSDETRRHTAGNMGEHIILNKMNWKHYRPCVCKTLFFLNFQRLRLGHFYVCCPPNSEMKYENSKEKQC